MAVLSTHDDLAEERKKIIRLLGEKGFSVSAYEQPDFPKSPNRSSRDICLDALGRVDISLLIINKRAGLTLGGNCAITHEEYVASIKKIFPPLFLWRKILGKSIRNIDRCICLLQKDREVFRFSAAM